MDHGWPLEIISNKTKGSRSHCKVATGVSLRSKVKPAQDMSWSFGSDSELDPTDVIKTSSSRHPVVSAPELFSDPCRQRRCWADSQSGSTEPIDQRMAPPVTPFCGVRVDLLVFWVRIQAFWNRSASWRGASIQRGLIFRHLTQPFPALDSRD